MTDDHAPLYVIGCMGHALLNLFDDLVPIHLDDASGLIHGLMVASGDRGKRFSKTFS